MKLFKTLAPLATAAALASAVLITPAAQADMSASVGIANMYLWRGVNVSPNGGQVSGELRWTNKIGLYGGAWTSSEDQGTETDLFFGYAMKAGPVDLDFSIWNYLYPENTVTSTNGTVTARPGLTDNNVTEFVVSAGIAGFTGGAYINIDPDNDDDIYLTFSYGLDKYSLTLGIWKRDKSSGDEYKHLTFTYAATDDLSFTVSKAFEDKSLGVEEDPIVQVAYGWSFDLK